MDAWKTALRLLPEALAETVQQYPAAEEIRLRPGKALNIVLAEAAHTLPDITVKQADLYRVLEIATGASLHAAAAGLRAGYIACRGLRIGVCGEAVYTGDELSGLRNISSLAIRIPHTVTGECDSLIESLLHPKPGSVLICAPPGVGKTSFLRALIRHAADEGFRVAVVDERNELSASFSGSAQFDLGQRSDVMVGVRKAEAAMMLLRGMNPQVIAMDEITQREDLAAVEEIAGCGVLLFATVHGRDRQDVQKRPLYKSLLERGIFDTLVTIRCTGGRRSYERESLT